MYQYTATGPLLDCWLSNEGFTSTHHRFSAPSGLQLHFSNQHPGCEINVLSSLPRSPGIVSR